MQDRLSLLLTRYLAKSATADERIELMKLMDEAWEPVQVESLLQQAWEQMPAEERVEWLNEKEPQILESIFSKASRVKPVAHRVHFLKTTWFRYAAIVLVMAGTAAYLYTSSFRRNPEVTETTAAPIPQNILPGGNKATLTLADGSTIILDSAVTGDLAKQGNTRIIKLDAGSLAYQGGIGKAEGQWNTITTPRGGQYQVVLPDGTKVWLNAASSITFPVTFGKDRTVIVQGESYLEVASNPRQPFFVKTGATTIHVLGTCFNVNAYSDEPAGQITLIDGRINVLNGPHRQLLQPVQQAVIRKDRIELNPDVNVSRILAWKNNVFSFEGKKFDEIMRQLARWYDIEVVYESGIPKISFRGEMSRNAELSDVLRFFAGNDIRFKLTGRKLTLL